MSPVSKPQPTGTGRYPCIRPQRFVNLVTGDIVTGRCGATTLDVCPGCAHLYREDAKTIIRSGVIQHLEVGDPVTFATLTPPGLWLPEAPERLRKTHRYYPRYWELRARGQVNLKKLRMEASRAVCGTCTAHARADRAPGTLVRDVPPVRHAPDDPLGGLPVNHSVFDYPAAVLWNYWIGDLWHRTVTYLRRAHCPEMQYVKVLEWSRRGVPHLHALITASLTPSQLREVVAAVNQSLGGQRQGWGEILDVRALTIKGDPDGALNIGRVTAYLAKYLTKTSGGGLPNTTAGNSHAEVHLTRLSWAARDLAGTLNRR